MISEDELVERFTYHAPHDSQVENFAMIRSIAHSFATYLNEVVPDSREKEIALTNLEEVVFWANSGVARHA